VRVVFVAIATQTLDLPVDPEVPGCPRDWCAVRLAQSLDRLFDLQAARKSSGTSVRQVALWPLLVTRNLQHEPGFEDMAGNQIR